MTELCTCGEEILEKFDTCWKCGVEYANISTQTPVNKTPSNKVTLRTKKKTVEKNDNSPRFTNITTFAVVISGLFLLINYLSENKSSNNRETHSINKAETTKCDGDQSCLSKVEQRFASTGKMILSERYTDGGVFIIEFMDQQRGVTGSAKVFTDCNCEITNVNVSTYQ